MSILRAKSLVNPLKYHMQAVQTKWLTLSGLYNCGKTHYKCRTAPHRELRYSCINCYAVMLWQWNAIKHLNKQLARLFTHSTCCHCKKNMLQVVCVLCMYAFCAWVFIKFQPFIVLDVKASLESMLLCSASCRTPAARGTIADIRFSKIVNWFVTICNFSGFCGVCHGCFTTFLKTWHDLLQIILP